MSDDVAGGAHPPSFRRGVLFTGSGSAANIAFLFLETMIAVRSLGPETFGVYAITVATVNFLVTAVDFGNKAALTKMIAGAERQQQMALANSALVFRLAVVAAASVVLLAAREVLALLDPSGLFRQLLIYLPLMLAVASIDELLLGMLQGFQSYRQLALAQVLRSALRMSLTALLLLVLDLGVLALVYSWIVSFAVSAAYQYVALPSGKGFVFRRPLLEEVLRFGFPLQATRFLWFLLRRVDVLLLGALAGPSSAAYFAVAVKIPEALQNLSESFTAVYFPTMASLLSTGRREQALQMLRQSLSLVSFAGAVGALIAVLFSREIIVLIFSETYAASSLAFALLTVALHMTLAVNLMGYTLTAAGYSGRSLGKNLWRTALHLAADVALIPILSYTGPALAALLSSYGTNPVALWLLRVSGLRFSAAPFIKQTLSLILCVGLYLWLMPSGLAPKVAVLGLFVVLNVGFAGISPGDLRLVWPQGPSAQAGRVRGQAHHG